MLKSEEVNKVRGLLQSALYAGNNYGSDPVVLDYIERSRLFLMEQLMSMSPETVDFEGGESVLVHAFKASPSMAIHWVRLRGPSAWAPTPKSPFPLAELIQSLKSSSSYPSARAPMFRWPRDVSEKGSQVKELMWGGLNAAMPLRVTSQATAVDGQALAAQAEVLEFCSHECSLFPAAEKMKWLAQHDGALVLGANHAPYLIKENLVSPSQMAWTKTWGRPKHSQAGHVQKPMLQVWLDDPSLPEPELTLAWLKKHGATPSQVELVQVRLLKQAVDQSFTWEHIATAVGRMENGWTHQEPSDTGLLWQTALAKRPHFLGGVLHTAGANSILPLRSHQGLGVWDFLAESFSADTSAPIQTWPALNEVLELGRRVPLEVSEHLTPLLFRTSELPHWWESWFDKTVSESPLAWLGPKEDQGLRTAVLWKGLLVGEGVSNAAQREIIATQLKLIHRAWERFPQHVAADVPAVLRGVQRYMELARVNLKADISVLLGDDTLPDPTPDALGWVGGLESQLGKPSAKSKPSRLMMEDTLKWLRLNALPLAPARKPGPRF